MTYRPSGSVQSTVNTTTTALNDTQTWTSSGELVPQNDLVIQLYTDQITDVYIEFSIDGTNWDSTLTYKTSASVIEFHRLVKGARYVRTRLENNSGSNQTFLRYVMSFGDYGPATTPGNLAVSQDVDTIVTRPHDWALDMALGRWSGYQAVRKFGYNSTVSTTEEDIWSGGGSYTGWLQTAATVRIRSGGNAADDASSGAGAQQITVEGLDENFNEATETIDTAGASASSATTTTFIRVFRAYVTEVGTYHGSNTGAIIIEETGGSAVVANIEAGRGQSQLGLYTVPAGKTAYLREYSFDVDGGKPTTCRIYQYRNADDVSAPYGGTGKRIVENIPDVDGHMEDHLTDLISFPAKTDIWMAAEVSAGGSDAAVSGRFSLILVDD